MRHILRRMFSTKLVEVGKLEAPKAEYAKGQTFLHRVFGYRGVVLFPWSAQLYDRDAATVDPSGAKRTSPLTSTTTTDQDAKATRGTYYLNLIDSRDSPYVRSQTEAVTFLGGREAGRSLHAIPGLDYCAHEDVIPYVTAESPPVHNDLFEQFFSLEKGAADPVALPALTSWQDQNYSLLELSDVHRETTENIRVTVVPFYMGCRTSHGNKTYWWRYSVRLENIGDETVQLRERHWRIFSLSGTLETVVGRGVVGQEPVLSKLQSAFQYSSHISLQCPSGHMWGTFKFDRADGSSFECRIPPFSLESRGDVPAGK